MKRCRKRRYRDRVSAEFHLAVIRRKDNTARGEREQRAYYCSRCRAHHLTHLRSWKESDG